MFNPCSKPSHERLVASLWMQTKHLLQLCQQQQKAHFSRCVTRRPTFTLETVVATRSLFFTHCAELHPSCSLESQLEKNNAVHALWAFTSPRFSPRKMVRSPAPLPSPPLAIVCARKARPRSCLVFGRYTFPRVARDMCHTTARSDAKFVTPPSSRRS